MSKYYFREDDDEACYTRASIITYMKNEGLTELTVFEAKREIGSGYFYCREFMEIGEVSESCGKQCDKYHPNNGKNGRCKHYGWCYEPTEKKRTFKVKEEQKNG